jgi:hypothetical protein
MHTVRYDKRIAFVVLPKVGLYRAVASFSYQAIQVPINEATCCIKLADQASQGLCVSIDDDECEK